MKSLLRRNATQGLLLIAMLSPSLGANAQLDNILKKGAGNDAMGGMGNPAGALAGQSFTAGSTGNLTGILQYCVKNNYLGGGEASSLSDKLMGKLGGSSAASSDKGYQEGMKGVLTSTDGKQLDLSGGAGTAGLTKQVCNQVLSQAKSLF
jgi:hypothetical protein